MPTILIYLPPLLFCVTGTTRDVYEDTARDRPGTEREEPVG